MDDQQKRRGIGRSVKKVPRGKKRVQLSMIVSAEIKTMIDEEAKRTGRTFSQTGEILIERALAVSLALRMIGDFEWMISSRSETAPFLGLLAGSDCAAASLSAKAKAVMAG